MGGQTTPSNLIFIVGVAGDTMLISLCRFICPFSRVRLQGKAMSTVRKGPLADGVWPTMITPFLNDEKKSIDWSGLDSTLKGIIERIAWSQAFLKVKSIVYC